MSTLRIYFQREPGLHRIFGFRNILTDMYPIGIFFCYLSGRRKPYVRESRRIKRSIMINVGASHALLGHNCVPSPSQPQCIRVHSTT